MAEFVNFDGVILRKAALRAIDTTSGDKITVFWMSGAVEEFLGYGVVRDAKEWLVGQTQTAPESIEVTEEHVQGTHVLCD